MPTAAQRERTQMRTKLYSGHMIPMGGRGGAPIPESNADASRPGLIQMWPIYLDMELAAAKPTLSLPDVAAMLEQQQAPAFHALAARQLSENELATIRAWYGRAQEKQEEQLGAALAQAQGRIMSQASGHHAQVMEELREVKHTLATLQENPERTPPPTQKRELDLMARVYKICNVERMGAILREFCSDRLVGLKKEDKAALIVEKVPRARLMEILAGDAQEPLAKRAKRGSVQAPNRTLAEFFEAPNAVVNQGAEQARPGALRADAPPTMGDLYFKMVPAGAAKDAICADSEFASTSTAPTDCGDSSPTSTTLTNGSEGERSGATDHGAGSAQPMDGTEAPPAEVIEAPRPSKESAIDPALRHLDAVEVLDANGDFLRWAPLTMAGLCGHPLPPRGKLCNNNAGDCPTHKRREQTLMEREDERAAIVAHGLCNVPVGDSACEKPLGRCYIHTDEWHQQRELRAMRAEDDVSCIADRGRCGVVPRSGGEQCHKPKGRCPNHAEEKARCESAIDSDPRERCRSRCMEGSRFCGKHLDYPNYSVVVQRWVAGRQQDGLPADEEDFMTFLRTEYPNASYQQPKIHDFQKFVAFFVNLSDPGDVAVVVE